MLCDETLRSLKSAVKGVPQFDSPVPVGFLQDEEAEYLEHRGLGFGFRVLGLAAWMSGFEGLGAEALTLGFRPCYRVPSVSNLSHGLFDSLGDLTKP